MSATVQPAVAVSSRVLQSGKVEKGKKRGKKKKKEEEEEKEERRR